MIVATGDLVWVRVGLDRRRLARVLARAKVAPYRVLVHWRRGSSGRGGWGSTAWVRCERLLRAATAEETAKAKVGAWHQVNEAARAARGER